MNDKITQPNKLLRQILDRIIPRHIGRSGLGDYDELFGIIHKEKGRIRANIWYLSQIIRLYPPYFINTTLWSFEMFRNYLKTAFRNLVRSKGSTFVNIFGLAIGITCCFLILLFIQDELSYDNFHDDVDQVYRLVDDFQFQNSYVPAPILPAAFAPVIKEEFPEIAEIARFRRFWSSNRLITYEDKKFYESKFYWVEPEIFSILKFNFVKGDPESLLKEPNTLIVTESIAEKYFGSEDPIGKVVKFNNSQDFTVTGVMQDLPHNSHLKIDFLTSFVSMPEQVRNSTWPYIYVRLREGVDAKDIESKMGSFLKERFAGTNLATAVKFNISLQPVTDIHLRSKLQYELQANGDINNIFIFSFIVILILLIASKNAP